MHYSDMQQLTCDTYLRHVQMHSVNGLLILVKLHVDYKVL